MASDGTLTIFEIVQRLNKATRVLPAWLLQTALSIGHRLSISRYGTEQLGFLRYRPVLLNTALKSRFGFSPGKTSAHAFDAFVAARQQQGQPIAH